MTLHNGAVAFERDYGVSNISITTGDTVTTISQPDWETFTQSLAGLAASGRQIGSLILTPELITSTDIGLGSTAHSRAVIEKRVAEAATLTTLFPEATLLLGTVVFDSAVPKPRNALVFLRNGVELGRTHKVSPRGLQEREAFHLSAQPSDIQKPKPNVMGIICSDLIRHPHIDDEVTTVLVSGCWGTPTGRPGWLASPDHRLARAIERSAGGLFARHPNLATVIMADRVPTPSTANGPFNFVARRSGKADARFPRSM